MTHLVLLRRWIRIECYRYKAKMPTKPLARHQRHHRLAGLGMVVFAHHVRIPMIRNSCVRWRRRAWSANLAGLGIVDHNRRVRVVGFGRFVAVGIVGLCRSDERLH